MRTVLLILLALFIIWSCSDESTNPARILYFEGILEVDESCIVIGGDTTDFTDWPKPGEPGRYSLIACPNPAQEKITEINWMIPIVDSVSIYIYDSPFGSPIDTICDQQMNAGQYSKIWECQGPAGIYRVIMVTNRYSSYGDIQILE